MRRHNYEVVYQHRSHQNILSMIKKIYISNFVRMTCFQNNIHHSKSNVNTQMLISDLNLKKYLAIILKFQPRMKRSGSKRRARIGYCFLPLLRRFNPAEPVVDKSVILQRIKMSRAFPPAELCRGPPKDFEIKFVLYNGRNKFSFSCPCGLRYFSLES